MPTIPSLYAKVLIATVLLCIGFGGGWKWRDGAYQQLRADVATEAQQQADLLIDETNLRIAAERDLAAKSNELDVANEKVRSYVHAQVDSLRTDIRSGTVRLSVPTKSCSITVTAGPSASSEPASEARAELLPATADALIALNAGCDAEVRERNELIDRYNLVRDAVNKLSGETYGQN